MSKVMNRETKNGFLHFQIDDLTFKVAHHPGRDAIRTRRLVNKLMVPYQAEMQALQMDLERKLPQADRDAIADIREKLTALEGVNNDTTKKLEAEAEAILQKYYDPKAEAEAVSRMASQMDLNDEALLDSLLFKHADVKGTGFPGYVPLKEDVYFDRAFTGPRAEFIELVRAEVIQFNGFLGKSAAKQEPETEA